MNTQIIKIIESGIKRDPKKVTQYTELLIENLKKDGDIRFAERLQRVLSLTSGSNASFATLDEISSQAPIDTETRMSMVEIERPKRNINIVLDSPIEEALNIFIEKIRNRDKLTKAGIDLNLSLLLYGPPGCGKTTLAHYISEKAGLPLITARLDTLVSSLLGSTAKNIRKVFEFANDKPCILFIDEFDAIAKARDDEHEHGELKRVINSLLQSIDQFDNVLITATNHSGILDSAVWRRFDTVIEVKKPSSPKFTSDILDSLTSSFEMEFLRDKKKKEKIIVALSQNSPSEIKTICNNAVTNSIINKEASVKYIHFLKEIFRHRNHGFIKDEELIKFFKENLVTQGDISEYMGLSLRKVKEINLKPKPAKNEKT